MKRKLFIWMSLIIVGLGSCNKAEDIKTDLIVDTKWKLIKIIDKSGEISTFPSEIDDFEILFQESSTIELTNLCNCSFGNYKILDGDSLSIYNIGEGTEKYCLPEKSMDWETLFINSLIMAESYSIRNNTLTIKCRENDLVFGS